jgi:hypothetical protein
MERGCAGILWGSTVMAADKQKIKQSILDAFKKDNIASLEHLAQQVADHCADKLSDQDVTSGPLYKSSTNNAFILYRL